MKTVKLTPDQARKIILHATGLSRRAPFGKGKEAVYKVIDHLGFVQIDTNYVVERAHHHSLFARVPGYKPEWLETLQTEGRIFEFWTFATGYMPMHDFRFSLPVKQSFAARRTETSQAELNLMNKILDRISREGPLRARDFENDRVKKSTGWWDWRPSKVALERLHFDGRLTTYRTKDFQKVYDLSGNVIPSDTDMTMPSAEAYERHVILRNLKALGIAHAKEISYSARFVEHSIKKTLEILADKKEIVRVEIDGIKGVLYMLPEYKTKKITLSEDVFILSPFDILNVFRHRLRDFFSFDYQVECFVPASKRKYGYFSLPVLSGDTFIARMDCKADRKTRTLTVNNLHFEKVEITTPMIERFSDAIMAYAEFNHCEKIEVKKTNDKKNVAAIKALISAP